MKIKINKATKQIDLWLKNLAKGNYEPIVHVWSGPKGTRRHCLRGFKAKRNHHFLSDGEYRNGIHQESLPSTIDYFEQFPLWDIERAIQIAGEMGVRYPVDKEGEAYIMSTDLLCREVCNQSNRMIKVARSYKPFEALRVESHHPRSVSRTLEKLEIERRYYAEMNINYELITNLDVSKTCALNLKTSRAAAWYAHEFKQHERSFNNLFVDVCAENPGCELKVNLERVMPRLGINYSDAYALFQWGVWTHQIPANLEVLINPFRPLELKSFV